MLFLGVPDFVYRAIQTMIAKQNLIEEKVEAVLRKTSRSSNQGTSEATTPLDIQLPLLTLRNLREISERVSTDSVFRKHLVSLFQLIIISISSDL